MKRNKKSTMPDTPYWHEYARKHPESAQREWDKIKANKGGTNYEPNA
ncbi:hypothetical protein HAP94_10030 [Acidithiobacillus ferrivorans]|nr:hypothetical protein [Acidithiobacillus ferrivorans]